MAERCPGDEIIRAGGRHVVLRGLCEADSYLANASALVSLRAVMQDCITST
jgi:hypothetical protein